MTAAYATTADLAAWLGTDAPEDSERLLRRASELLDATVYGAYAVDSRRACRRIPTQPPPCATPPAPRWSSGPKSARRTTSTAAPAAR